MIQFIQDFDLFRKAMAQRVCHFQYMKVRGGVRDAWGTTSPQLIPKDKQQFRGRGKKPNPNTYRYFDLQRNAWRCHRIDLFMAMLVEE